MLRFGLSFLCIGGAPRPRQKSAKVFEIKELSLDFGCGYGTKVESPACAGLWFLPDLIVAAVSRLVRPGAEALFGGWLFRGAEAPRLIPRNERQKQRQRRYTVASPYGLCSGLRQSGGRCAAGLNAGLKPSSNPKGKSERKNVVR